MNAPAYVKGWLDAIEGDEKFVASAFAGVITTGLLVAHYIDQGTWAMVFMGTVAAFITGNVITNMQAGRAASKE